MKAQEIVEYTLMLVLALVVAITIGVLLFGTSEPCADTHDNSFACRDACVQECIDSEQYTRAECITLMGGEK